MRGLVVRVGEEWLVVDVSAVGEVLDAPVPTRLPGDAVGVEGVISLRGTVVPLWRTDQLLGLAGSSSPGVCVRLRSGGVQLALLVDEVHGLAAITDERGPSAAWWADGSVHLDVGGAAETATIIATAAVIARSER